ncbi:MAG TPA: TRAP transporter large permease [Candidatus Baltobacteraceae bacterium]|nr:TRAP transporter large permease [Candidatus Baltobacteraceae bacterium]
MSSLVVLLAMVVLMLCGASIAVSIGVASIAVMWAMGGSKLLIMLVQRMWMGGTSFPLLAVPFFILAGNLMNRGGVTIRIFDVARVLVGGIRGGLAHMVIVASMIFAGMTGSAIAEAAGLAIVSVNEMSGAGYSRRFAATLIAAASTIGPIIPPSIPFVIYGSLANVSVGRLFLAGFLPGILMGVFLMVAVSIISWRANVQRSARLPWAQTGRILLKGIPAFGIPIIIIGGILGGFFTATEASAVAVVYGLVLGFLVDRELQWADLPELLWVSAKQTTQVLFIIAVASAFGWVIVQQQVPNLILNSLFSLTRDPRLILLIINVVLLILGCLMESLAIMIMTLPIFLPIIAAVGISPDHFGVVMVLNLMIGLITPPVGVALFAVGAVAEVPFRHLAHDIWPYVIALIGVLAIVTYMPDLILWVPNRFMGGAQ